IKLVQVCRLDFELQSGDASVAPRQRDKDTGGEPTLLRRLQLAADEIQCLLPVDGQHVVGKPRYVHDQASLTSSHSNAGRTALFCTSAKNGPRSEDPFALRRQS